MVDALLQARLFDQAVGLAPEERETFLSRSGADEETTAAVRRLLAHHDSAGGFLSKPAAEAYAELGGYVGDQLEEFRILRELGRGGMGVVYLAEDLELGREVALKTLRIDFVASERARRRFESESRSVARLSHAHIVPIFRSGVSDGTPFLVFEYVKGPNLAERIGARRAGATADESISPEDGVKAVEEVASAVAYAHLQGVLHRDIKPANILFDGSGSARLTDFGVARILDEEPQTLTPEFPGTPCYMSPEQVGGGEVDERSDVFSIGVVLFETLTGERPFDGKTLADMHRAYSAESPKRLRRLRPGASADLETICEKAIEVNPRDRYPSAAHLEAELRSYRSGEPIVARRPGLWQRARRLVRRNPLRVAIAALVLSVLTGGGFAASYVASERARMGSLIVANIEPEAVLTLSRFDEITMEPMVQVPLDADLSAGILLEPGAYRLTAVAADESFVEYQGLVRPSGELRFVAPNPGTRASLEEMIFFEGGDYLFRGDMRRAPEGRIVRVEDFYLDVKEVTNAEYRAFLDDTGYTWPAHWQMLGYDDALADFPVVQVALEDAEAYARWRGCRLPTALEWQYAATRPDGRPFPWGVDPAASPPELQPSCELLCDSASNGIEGLYEEYRTYAAPTLSAEDVLASGLHGMFSGPSEWTASYYFEDQVTSIRAGRCWRDCPSAFDLTRWVETKVGEPSFRVGFRCARSADPASISP